MLTYEIGKASMFLQALRIHVKYVLRALNLPQGRLPRMMAEEVIRQRSSWFIEWQQLATQVGIELSAENRRVWRSQWEQMFERLQIREREDLRARIEASQFHCHYREVTLTPLPDYNGCLDLTQARWVFKARGGLIYLNFQPWRSQLAQRCSLCNLNEVEDIFHFLAKCPILSAIRKKWSGVGQMSREEFTRRLAQPNFVQIAGFCREAWSFRFQLVQQFNY
ncbi:hypothetical protein GE061_014356 [Apolygus lucorum]|uniref:Uncharacterized protein n=1 Tax=Apolygus lucorum TaxID=248454 RepID=A0A8S9XQD8_APOLU|nr:hypothetical protein GE061_014356 [Apolygus lucorum]